MLTAYCSKHFICTSDIINSIQVTNVVTVIYVNHVKLFFYKNLLDSCQTRCSFFTVDFLCKS